MLLHFPDARESESPKETVCFERKGLDKYCLYSEASPLCSPLSVVQQKT